MATLKARRRPLARLVQADLVPILILTTLGLTIWYAVSGYLGSYQGGKLWVSAAGVAVSESHNNQLAALQRRATAILLGSDPGRALSQGEAFIRMTQASAEEYGDPSAVLQLRRVGEKLRADLAPIAGKSEDRQLPRGVIWFDDHLHAVVTARHGDSWGVLSSEVTEEWLAQDKRLTATEISLIDPSGEVAATSYRDAEGQQAYAGIASDGNLDVTELEPELGEHIRVYLSAPYAGAQEQRWHEGQSDFLAFSYVAPMRSPLGTREGGIWITVPENVMLGWSKFGVGGTAILGIFFASLMLLVMRKRLTTVTAPLNELSTRVVSLREQLESTELEEDFESFSGHGGGDFLTEADEVWKLSHGVARLEREMQRTSELEGQLRQAQKMEAMGTLAGGIAHDFNNLLSVILLNAETLADDLASSLGDDNASLREESTELLAEVLSSCEHGKSLTTQLLGMSGRGYGAKGVFAFQTAAREVVLMMKRLIPESITIREDFSAVSCGIKGDKNAFIQVLMNLLLNARDASSDGGEIIIRTSQRTQLTSTVHTEGLLDPGEYAVLSVVDCGMGISKERLRNIFEPFVTSKGQRGTGLGLTVVRHAMLSGFGGAIDIVSEEGEGTTFELFFPVVSHDESTEESGRTQSPTAQGSHFNIALVEDNDVVRASLERALRAEGHSVKSFSSGQRVIEWVTAEPEVKLDILVSDVVMPGKSGPATYQALREIRSDVRVLFVSGYADSSFSGIHLRSEQLVHKPVTREVLSARIQQVMDSPQR